ncbi:MAG: hypothetical protein COX17_02290 [Deltaproteobacteria bacterium CG23_combo_of_CG06-09_8_20_14_all_60_8]|nr:MAG: hypothetical protein AUK28_10765 [Desulfobacterales bacterium CG2_30_60_27]PIP44277.1 MAG: hypothetical protein COX17_02290 [Deltaproteobacteria bacterium CG23_combo_of_CG06-09_8_20_14_all_60_8]
MNNTSFLLAATGTCALIFGAATSPHAALIVPPGLAPGATYQLAFVTSGTTTATSSEIGDYNSFVQNAANAAGMGSVVWYVIGSTVSVDANSNALVSAPVYNMNSELVATGFSDFWDGSHTLGVGIDFNENNTARNFNVWTGSNTNGTNAGIYALGNAKAIWAESTLSSGAWIYHGTQDTTVSYSLYALSGPLSTPVPLPPAIWLCGSGLLGLIGVTWREDRK